ncbi:hypothetical protein ACPA9J_31695 [Pseudomonas aeruginosa]
MSAASDFLPCRPCRWLPLSILEAQCHPQPAPAVRGFSVRETPLWIGKACASSESLPSTATSLQNCTYSPSLVALAFLVACLAGYTALDMVERVGNSLSHPRLWQWIGAFCLGSGIWATHFVAMLCVPRADRPALRPADHRPDRC